MKNILVNIVYRQEDYKDNILDIISKCRSENYDVYINICDYTLKKDANSLDLSAIESDSNNVNVLELDYEDLSDHDRKIFQLVDSKEFLAVIDLDASVQSEDNFIDDLEVNVLEDNNYGCVYSDFYSKTKSGKKIYIYQKSFPFVSNAVPLVAFSVENYVKNINEENIKGMILSNLISRHIPKALCCMSND